jgi:hypothetical protein
MSSQQPCIMLQEIQKTVKHNVKMGSKRMNTDNRQQSKNLSPIKIYKKNISEYSSPERNDRNVERNTEFKVRNLN